MDLFQMIPVRSVLYPEHLEKNRPSHTGPALLSSAGFSQQISIFHYSTAYTSSSTPVLIIAKTNKYQDTRTLFPIIFKIFINQDRKSTRLNSSHVASSYAVFCLKKK